MKKIYLELTNKCNLNCIMCYRKAWHEATKDMEQQYLLKCVEEIKSSDSVLEVVLGGIGEPTFAEAIEWVIEALKNKQLTITTNGTLLSDSLLQKILDHVDKLVVSVDGIGDTFYAIRHFPLDEILNNIQRINEQKLKRKQSTPSISFQMVISSYNFNEINDVIKLAAEYNVDEVILSNLVPSVLEDIPLSMFKMYEKEPLSTILKKANRIALSNRVTLRLPEIRMKTERHCRFIEDETMMITVDGFVVPCYRFAHNSSEVVFDRLKDIKAHHFGHIEKQSLKEIWMNEAYVSYRNMVINNLYPSCMDCDWVDGCDMANNAESDCFGNVPSCADCLWARRIIQCV